MSNSEFSHISNFIFTQYGIKMPLVKKTMLESRLQKRLRALNIPSFQEYFGYVFSKEGEREELIHMVDVVTTNKTDFFREPEHFNFLTNSILPEMLENDEKRNLKFWSAGCSSGEEPYTLSIVLQEYAEENTPFTFSVFATDLCSEVLSKGITAVYPEERVSGLPLLLKRKYFLKGKESSNRTVRVVGDLRKKVTFQRLNFMDDSYNTPHPFDIIFCRNVLIYFDKDTQERVINKIVSKLKPGGFFFLGHSESITHMNVPLQQIKPTIFRKV